MSDSMEHFGLTLDEHEQASRIPEWADQSAGECR